MIQDLTLVPQGTFDAITGVTSDGRNVYTQYRQLGMNTVYAATNTGSVTLFGNTITFAEGDYVIINSNSRTNPLVKLINLANGSYTSAVNSVNGQTGAVVLDNTDIGLGNVQNVNQTVAGNISSGTLADARLSSNVTLQGNTFNGNSQLVQTDSSGRLPALNASQLTNLSKSQVGLSQVVNVNSTNASTLASGTVPDARLSGNVTVQGNNFNGANQLIKTDSNGMYPPLNASNVTNLNASSLSSGTVPTARLPQATNSTLGIVRPDNSTIIINNGVLTAIGGGGGGGDVTSVNGQTGAVVLTKSDIGLSNVQNVDQTNANNITSGTLSNARLDASVTTQGNTFNGNSQLVQTLSDGKLPVLDGSNLTNIVAEPYFSPRVTNGVFDPTMTTQYFISSQTININDMVLGRDYQFFANGADVTITFTNGTLNGFTQAGTSTTQTIFNGESLIFTKLDTNIVILN